MMTAVSASMESRTGRTLEEWVSAVQASGVDPFEQGEVRKWLKREHGVPQNSQWAIADAAARAAGWVRPSIEETIDQQYAGAKSSLRPICEALMELILALGDDVQLEGRTTYLPFVRGRQFAVIAPTTKSRIDFGLRFRDPPTSRRLLTNALPGQATHRIALSDVASIDDDISRLARIAYEQNE